MLTSQETNLRVALAHETAVIQDRQADTFIWCPTDLLACFNNEVVGPVNPREVLRWIRKMMWRRHRQVKLDLQPVGIEPYNDSYKPIQCHPVEGESVKPAADCVELLPGDYCFYAQDPRLDTTKVFPTSQMLTVPVPYSRLGVYVRADRDLARKQGYQIDKIPEDMTCEARKRSQSQGTCALTGYNGEETITQWIFPPSQAGLVPIPRDNINDIEHDDEGFTHVANLITMRKDLYDMFLENAFGVDVEDDFKIRVFHASAKAVALPARLEISEADEYVKYFLEIHFRWCLGVYFYGGSIEDDKLLGRDALRIFLQRMKADYSSEENPGLRGRLTEEDWETRLGRGISEFLKYRDSKNRSVAAAAEAAGSLTEPGN